MTLPIDEGVGQIREKLISLGLDRKTLVVTPAEQLTLLPTATVPARFLLSRDTRERGLRHVAEIRRMLAERSEAVTGDRAA